MRNRVSSLQERSETKTTTVAAGAHRDSLAAAFQGSRRVRGWCLHMKASIKITPRFRQARAMASASRASSARGFSQRMCLPASRPPAPRAYAARLAAECRLRRSRGPRASPGMKRRPLQNRILEPKLAIRLRRGSRVRAARRTLTLRCPGSGRAWRSAPPRIPQRILFEEVMNEILRTPLPRDATHLASVDSRDGGVDAVPRSQSD